MKQKSVYLYFSHVTMTVVHYPVSVHLQEAYEGLGLKKGDFPVTEKYCNDILSLPIFPELEEGDIKKVCMLINKFCFKNYYVIYGTMVEKEGRTQILSIPLEVGGWGDCPHSDYAMRRALCAKRVLEVGTVPQK